MKESTEICVVIRSSSRAYSNKRIAADVCTIEDGKLRSVSSTDARRHIVCSTYVGHDFGDRPENELWGWEVKAEDIGYASASELEATAKVIRMIERKMAKYLESEGSAETFGQFVNRFARALGASKVCRIDLLGKQGGFMPIKDAAWLVDTARRDDFPTKEERAKREAQQATA